MTSIIIIKFWRINIKIKHENWIKIHKVTFLLYQLLIFVVYLFRQRDCNKKRFIHGRLMNIFLFTKQLFKVGLVIVSWHLSIFFMHFLFLFCRLTEICFLVNQSITIFEILIIDQRQVKPHQKNLSQDHCYRFCMKEQTNY